MIIRKYPLISPTQSDQNLVTDSQTDHNQITTMVEQKAGPRSVVSRRMKEEVNGLMPFKTFMEKSYRRWMKQWGSAAANTDTTTTHYANLVLGNPQESTLVPGYIDALTKSLQPKHAHWYAYRDEAPEAEQVIATTLSGRAKKEYEMLHSEVDSRI